MRSLETDLEDVAIHSGVEDCKVDLLDAALDQLERWPPSALRLTCGA